MMRDAAAPIFANLIERLWPRDITYPSATKRGVGFSLTFHPAPRTLPQRPARAKIGLCNCRQYRWKDDNSVEVDEIGQ